MDFNTFEELQKVLVKISKRGFIQSHRLDNTGIGKTLEDEMGITENNHPTGDFRVGNDLAELKAQRKHATSPVTLYTKEPEWILNKLETIHKTGYPDKKGRHGLKVTLKVTKPNNKGFSLTSNEAEVCIIHKDLGRTCFFDTKSIIKIIKAKMDHLLVVLAETKKVNQIEHFHYTDAIYFKGFKEEVFKKLLNEGAIVWEFRLHLKESGAIRDHGSGFRTNRKNIPLFFTQQIPLMNSGKPVKIS